MRLEYKHLGQPCGKWRAKYGTHLGLCVRKLSILKRWDEIDEGLKKALWEDTANLFHIEADKDKEKVFMLGVAQSFINFKSMLVSTWIKKKENKKWSWEEQK